MTSCDIILCYFIHSDDYYTIFVVLRISCCVMFILNFVDVLGMIYTYQPRGNTGSRVLLVYS